MEDLIVEEMVLICEDSLEGVFTAIYQVYAGHLQEKPVRIQTCEDENYKLFVQYIHVDTDVTKAVKVMRTLRQRFGEDVYKDLCMALAAEDIDKAQAAPLEPRVFFYCPNILKIDYYGNVFYDAEWKPDDENCGTTVPYWYALMEPVHGRRNRPEDFKKVNEALFPNGADRLDIYEWTTDWSDFFDAGHEWYGACCWTVYDGSMDRYAVMIVSATD